MEKNIFDLIVNSSNSHPKNVFLKDINKEFNITYKYTLSFIYKLNNYLLKNKIKKKEKIIVIFDNSILLSLLFLGITSTNRVFVPINPDIGKFEFLNILKSSGAKHSIIDKVYKKKFSKFFKNKTIYVGKHIDFIHRVFSEKEKYFCKEFTGLCEILYTSGSTGNPKGVMLTHQSILANLRGLEKSLNLKKFKNFMAITPLFHNNGQFIPTLLSIKTNGTSLPVNSKTSIIIFWNLVKEFKINYSSVMSTHINYLLKSSKKFTNHNLLGLFCGGAKLDKNIQNKFENKFAVKIACNYGLTETSSIVSTENLKKNKNFGSVGKPLFNNKVKIINKNKIKKNLGEIIIKGKNIFFGYIKNRKKTNKVLLNNWLHTGDLGKFDNKGNLYIHERKDNMIIVSGENIFPTEIEKFANNYNKIKFCVVVPVKDEIFQNKLVLVYETNYKIEESDVLNYLYKKISTYKLPKIAINCKKLGLNEIPKASNGKILRNKIINHVNEFLI